MDSSLAVPAWMAKIITDTLRSAMSLRKNVFPGYFLDNLWTLLNYFLRYNVFSKQNIPTASSYSTCVRLSKTMNMKYIWILIIFESSWHKTKDENLKLPTICQYHIDFAVLWSAVSSETENSPALRQSLRIPYRITIKMIEFGVLHLFPFNNAMTTDMKIHIHNMGKTDELLQNIRHISAYSLRQATH